MSRFLQLLAFGALSVAGSNVGAEVADHAPNVILIVADDLGYGDLGCYGSKTIRTPHLDLLAAEGARYTDFYVASSVCSASRAALFSGKYPVTIGVDWVISANSDDAVPHDEQLLSERMRGMGYETALVGKWHLGNDPENWPTSRGFDRWFGTVGSNDMGKGKPSLETRRAGKAGVELVDFVDGVPVIELNPDQSLLTKRYTDRAIEFLDEVEGRTPFFLCVTYNMPHTPLFPGAEFAGKSKGGIYGDVVEEIDHSVGRILDALDDSDDSTLVMFTSDNGPWLIFGNHGGSAAPYAGGKKQTFEGGHRVPFIARWSGVIKSGQVVSKMTTALDIVPTLVSICGGHLLENDRFHGRVLAEFGANTSEGDPYHASYPFFFFQRKQIRSVRNGDWKYRRAHLDPEMPVRDAIGMGGERGQVRSERLPEALFNLADDPAETVNLVATNPVVAAKLNQLIEVAETKLISP